MLIINREIFNGRQFVVTLLMVVVILCSLVSTATKSPTPIPIGVVLDLETESGKVWNTTISMAVEDFYTSHRDYRTRLALAIRDSKQDVFASAATVVDLLGNVEVKAIIGPTDSTQARIVSEFGNKTQVPIISFSASSPLLSHANMPYFIRTGLNDSSQVGAIADIVNYFRWNEVVPIYEDSEYGNGIIPFLYDALSTVNVKISYRGSSSIPPIATDNQIVSVLNVLKSYEARVFVVHMKPSLGWRLFKKADEIGMMGEGYVWIITDGMSSALDLADPSTVPFDSMQGVLGVKPYMQTSERLNNFNSRWKTRVRKGDQNFNPDVSLDVHALWAYDTVWAVAMATEKVVEYSASTSDHIDKTINFTLGKLKTSSIGSKLVDAILTTTFSGISGKFHLVDGQLQLTSPFQVVNVNERTAGREVGFWEPRFGLSRRLSGGINITTDVLGPLIWPGEAKQQPKGRRILLSTKEEKNRSITVIVPWKNGFNEFVNIDSYDNITEKANVSGFSIKVFEEAIKNISSLNIKGYKPFPINDTSTYDDMCEQLKEDEVIVGDVTILAKRSYVEFTLPYSDSGIALLVLTNKNEYARTGSPWIFFRPWKWDLWLMIFGFLFLTALMVWVIEHRVNPEFRGPPSQQMSLVLYLVFSTLVFPQKEMLVSKLSRIAYIVWVITIFILTTTYTASLTSMLTVENLKGPSITDLASILKNGDNVGYQCGSFFDKTLIDFGFSKSKIHCYSTPDEYNTALSNGSVSGILDEIPYIKLFLNKYSANYTMVPQTHKGFGMSRAQKTYGYGFGFVFHRGDPLVLNVSKGVTNVTQGTTIGDIEKLYFGAKKSNEDNQNYRQLSFQNFWGLFVFTGGTSGIAIIVFLINFTRQNWGEIKNAIFCDSPIKTKISMVVSMFDKKDFGTFEHGVDDSHRDTNSSNVRTPRYSRSNDETPFIQLVKTRCETSTSSIEYPKYARFRSLGSHTTNV